MSIDVFWGPSGFLVAECIDLRSGLIPVFVFRGEKGVRSRDQQLAQVCEFKVNIETSEMVGNCESVAVVTPRGTLFIDPDNRIVIPTEKTGIESNRGESLLEASQDFRGLTIVRLSAKMTPKLLFGFAFSEFRSVSEIRVALGNSSVPTAKIIGGYTCFPKEDDKAASVVLPTMLFDLANCNFWVSGLDGAVRFLSSTEPETERPQPGEEPAATESE